MKNGKSRNNARLTDTDNTWQGWQDWNQTFDAELDKVDIEEIKELLEGNDEEQC